MRAFGRECACTVVFVLLCVVTLAVSEANGELVLLPPLFPSSVVTSTTPGAMGVHKNTEHESGYFEDEEDDDDVGIREQIGRFLSETRDDEVDVSLAEGEAAHADDVAPTDARSEYHNVY